MKTSSQSASEVQRNVKNFKQQRASKKLPDDDKLSTLQGLSLQLDAPNDTPPDSSVTIVPETVDVLHDDSPAIVDRVVASDTLPAVDSIPAQITAVNVLIAQTNDLQQLRAIRFSLTETLASLDSKLVELTQEH